MKKYFKVKIPNNYEWIQMKRIAIKLYLQQGKTVEDICKLVDLTRSNVFRNRRLKVDKEIDNLFVYYVNNSLYPVKHKTKTKWIKL
jgi:hypothetical protein